LIQAQIQALLTDRQTLSRNRFQRFQPTLVVGRTQMLDLA
jgi:hypothetical protein